VKRAQVKQAWESFKEEKSSWRALVATTHKHQLIGEH